MRLTGLILTGVLLAAGCGSSGSERVITAAGTTLVDSGFLNELARRYDAADAPADLSIIGESTRQVLELGRRGGAGLLITHAPDAEQVFLAENDTVAYELVFTSRFLLVGPPELARELDGLTAAEALVRIADEGQPFVSRGDGSGTHIAELALWDAAGVDPSAEPWYDETGQGMGLTLQVADQRSAWVFAEDGAFLAAEPTVSLQPVTLASDLENPYHATVVAGDASGAAAGFVDWLATPDGRQAIIDVNEVLFGRVVYAPPG
jgi:tungstate transport system substrate-binding protein